MCHFAVLTHQLVDNLITGGETTNDVCHLKNTAVAILFGEAGSELHKWHSNEQTLESEASSLQEDEKRSCAKEQLGIKPSETKMLGLPWDKLKDMMAVTFPVDETLNKHSFWKTIQVTAWIMHFVWNCKGNKSEGLASPLTTPETDKAVHWWVKRVQESNMGTEKFKQDQLS